MDAIVAAAHRHGIKLLPIVAYVPHWASDERDWWAFPDTRPFEDFFEAALRRYPHISAWSSGTSPTSVSSPSHGPIRPDSLPSFAARIGCAHRWVPAPS